MERPGQLPWPHGQIIQPLPTSILLRLQAPCTRIVFPP